MPREDTITFTPKDIERFWAKVDKGDEDDCWEWTGATSGQRPIGNCWMRTSSGRGNFLAHRVSYALHFGRIDRGTHIERTCRNSRCVYPLHLMTTEAGV